METHFILDTNAYRQLADGKYYCEIIPTATEFRKRENKLNAKTLLNIVVSMELIKHLETGDPFLENCYKALAFQFFHTQTKEYGEANNEISFLPPLNTILTRHYFDENSQYFKYYVEIIRLTMDVTNDMEIDDIKKEKKNIQLIAEQLKFERSEIQGNLAKYIQEINGGIVDWELFKNNKLLKKSLLDDIKKGKTKNALTLSLCQRAYSLLDKHDTEKIKTDSILDFEKYYDPLLNLNQTLIEKLIHGVVALSDPLSEKWNTLNDVQILGSACYNSLREKDNDSRTIIVTDDKAIRTACQNTYLQDNIWKLREYIAFVYQ